MYTLYYMPGACSRAINALLNELGQPAELADRNQTESFDDINPLGQVPVLIDGDLVLREGVAIILHLLEKHQSEMLPKQEPERARFLQQLLFANATMHPAYGRLFFIAQAIEDKAAQQAAYEKASGMISDLWAKVNEHVKQNRYMCGDKLTVVDMMLAVYANWGSMFPVDIQLGSHVEALIEKVKTYPAFERAVEAEEARQTA